MLEALPINDGHSQPHPMLRCLPPSSELISRLPPTHYVLPSLPARGELWHNLVGDDPLTNAQILLPHPAAALASTSQFNVAPNSTLCLLCIGAAHLSSHPRSPIRSGIPPRHYTHAIHFHLHPSARFLQPSASTNRSRRPPSVDLPPWH